ncbi:NADH-quinone oxidoreductase subunit D [Leekyejoonella antrihumi]|uniref:NADH-quinone oxidoreductase subunit D n=1 Tax=Leekyejoonella antrihumi TaxID=1660198 RepID=A0A563E462_9MICO|nr:NADH-quinone oxidoreductase subunit D [Leekyejoonella antrihumi]TWP37307.1 NADH-quinone oxidoreductase subunit D [Leekyejoonella antrihumi]
MTTHTNSAHTAGSDAFGASTPGDVDADTPVLNAVGGDWDDLVDEAAAMHEERIVVNMGPQHPSTHGVLRLILELDGETVTEARAGIGYLHTGIEKNMEFRTWTQGVTFCTRMDYVMPLFNEAVYCLAVEKALGITDQIPERANVIRVLMMELNRAASHLVAIATGGMEMGATTVMTIGFRERERILEVFEMVSGLRMNNNYIRPGGVAQDIPAGCIDKVREMVPLVHKGTKEIEDLLNENPILKARTVDVGYLDLTGCIALGATGPILRSAGLPYDLRKADPYCGYETYDFEVITRDTCDSYAKLRNRLDEIHESLKIVDQCIERLDKNPGPVMVEDKKIAWPAQMSVGGDGQGNSLDHIREIMGESMESLIHHFKLVTEGFRVPPGQAYVAIESPKGELGCHVVSDGGTRPYRAHFRDPSFNNLQAVAAMSEGGSVADVIIAVASIDPVMGGVDR